MIWVTNNVRNHQANVEIFLNSSQTFIVASIHNFCSFSLRHRCMTQGTPTMTYSLLSPLSWTPAPLQGCSPPTHPWPRPPERPCHRNHTLRDPNFYTPWPTYHRQWTETSWLPYSTYLYLDFHLLFHDKAKRTQQGYLLHCDCHDHCHSQSLYPFVAKSRSQD